MSLPRFRVMLCAAAIGLIVTSAQAQSDDNQETIKIRTDLVVVDAQVVDKRSREPIRGLTPADFELLEDGAKQKIEYLSNDKLPLSIILLLDVSPSVRPVIEKIREGALAALQKLKPEDEVALMTFSGWTELVQDFTRDRPLILEKLNDAMKKGGSGTRIHEAVAKAARQMRYATQPTSRRVIIVITDNQGAMNRRGDTVSEEEVRQAVADSGATVCGLIVRSLLNVLNTVLIQHPQIQDQIKTTSVNPYAEQTGGEMSGSSKDEINIRLGEMFEHLRSRYSLGYIPANQNFNGKFRRIKLGLTPEARKRLGGEITIRTKQGYFAVDLESQELLAEAEANADEEKPVVPTATTSAEKAGRPVALPETGIGAVSTDPNMTVLNDPAAVGRWQAAFRNAFRKTERPNARLQMFDVLAVNKKTGAVIENLSAKDFEIDEQGIKRGIAHFSSGPAPISVILLVDVSGRTPYMMSSLRRNVLQWLRAIRPEDEIALMAFGSGAAVLQEFTKDRKLIAGRLRDYIETARKKEVGFGQQRAMAVFQAAEYMDKAANPAGRRVIITLTDDAQQFSLPMESNQTVEMLLETGTTVYALIAPAEKPSQMHRAMRRAAYGALISFGNPVSIVTQVVTSMVTEAVLDSITRDRAFSQIIRKTGGMAIKVNADLATDNLAQLLDRAHNRYLMGFAPAVVDSNTNVIFDPKKGIKDITKHERYRNVQFSLSPEARKRLGDVSILTAPGYFARKATAVESVNDQQAASKQ